MIRFNDYKVDRAKVDAVMARLGVSWEWNEWGDSLTVWTEAHEGVSEGRLPVRHTSPTLGLAQVLTAFPLMIGVGGLHRQTGVGALTGNDSHNLASSRMNRSPSAIDTNRE